MGILVEDAHGRQTACFTEYSVCTFYDCENNGGGYKEREDYICLAAVPENFETEVGQ